MDQISVSVLLNDVVRQTCGEKFWRLAIRAGCDGGVLGEAEASAAAQLRQARSAGAQDGGVSRQPSFGASSTVAPKLLF